MVNATALHEELVAAGLPVDLVDSSGRVVYTRALMPAEQATAAAVVAAHNPATGTQRKRAIEAARTLAQTLNGVVVTALTATQVRNGFILLAAKEGWVKWNGTAWAINITAEDIQAMLR